MKHLSDDVNRFIFVYIYIQRTTDLDAIELYNKKVKTTDKHTGNVSFNYEKPLDGVKQIKAGGEYIDEYYNFFKQYFEIIFYYDRISFIKIYLNDCWNNSSGK